MAKRFEIVEETIQTIFINDIGNWERKNKDVFSLKDEANNNVSHQYYCILNLSGDHFIVCNPVTEITYKAFPNEYALMLNEINLETNVKWGIIRVNRDINGEIIPKAETLVVPYIYDQIKGSNLQTAIACYNQKYTYLDLDISSPSYNQQLVPCLLENASPFSNKYEGFAECCLDGVVGYLPRNCKTKTHIEGKELLTSKQVRQIQQKIYFPKQNILDYETMVAYFNLTDTEIEQNKNTKLAKKKSL